LVRSALPCCSALPAPPCPAFPSLFPRRSCLRFFSSLLPSQSCAFLGRVPLACWLPVLEGRLLSLLAYCLLAPYRQHTGSPTLPNAPAFQHMLAAPRRFLFPSAPFLPLSLPSTALPAASNARPPTSSFTPLSYACPALTCCGACSSTGRSLLQPPAALNL